MRRWLVIATAALTLAVGVPTLVSWAARLGDRTRAGRIASPSPSPSVSWSVQLRLRYGAAPTPTPEPEPLDASKLFDMTNDERTARGLAPLRWWPQAVGVAARAQAERMLAEQRVFHNPDLRSLLYSLNVEDIGENVGKGLAIENIQDAFMQSREHRANILDPDFRLAAVYAIRDVQGEEWVCVVFAAPRAASSATR
jgi:uncharacterized protein YkwD